MGISRTFAEKGENRALYLSRQDARRVQITMENEAAATRAALLQARAAEAHERAENERLRQLLRQMGTDPDQPKQT